MTDPPRPGNLYRIAFAFLFGCLVLCRPACAQDQLVKTLTDSTVLVKAGTHYDRSWLYQLFFGKHYRKVWAEPVVADVFDITSEMDGLEATKMGGSYQTKNLRLKDSEGKEFVLRSVDKNPTQKFAPIVQNSFIGKIIRDQTSVIHPYAYYIVPTLSGAADVYHTNPKLVYIPDDPDLGKFREEFAHMLAMLEERPTGDREEVSSFGHSSKIYSSRSAFAKIYADPCHRIDARIHLRSRLFDVLIGDWSRREDQWRWASFPDGEGTLYRGIPRDRDHAFFKLDDGIIPWIFTRFQRNLQSFHHKINHLEGLTLSGKPMDESFLVFLEEKDFVEEAERMKAAITDAVIDEAIAVWPKNIQDISGKEFRSKLRARRDQLPKVAREFYRLLAKEVSIPGSDRADRFYIEQRTDGSTKISLYSKPKECLTDTLIGQRVFLPKHTALIKIYGLGGDDVIEIDRQKRKAIKLQLHGGEGEDSFIVRSTARGNKKQKQIRIYDPDDGDSHSGKEHFKLMEGYKPLAEEHNATGWLLRHRLH